MHREFIRANVNEEGVGISGRSRRQLSDYGAGFIPAKKRGGIGVLDGNLSPQDSRNYIQQAMGKP